MDPVVRRVIDAVLLDGTDDFVLLDSLLWHARVEAEKESRDYREAVAEVGFTLVDAGLAVIGDLDDGVVPWAGTAQQVAKRLTSQCEELGWWVVCCW